MLFIIFGVTILALCVILVLSHQRIIFLLSSEENFSLYLLSGSNIHAFNCPLATTYIFPFTTLEALSSYVEVKYSVLRVAQKLNAEEM